MVHSIFELSSVTCSVLWNSNYGLAAARLIFFPMMCVTLPGQTSSNQTTSQMLQYGDVEDDALQKTSKTEIFMLNLSKKYQSIFKEKSIFPCSVTPLTSDCRGLRNFPIIYAALAIWSNLCICASNVILTHRLPHNITYSGSRVTVRNIITWAISFAVTCSLLLQDI